MAAEEGGSVSVRKAKTKNRHVVSEIVETGLCVRCAACEPACPFDVIRLDASHYPYITDEAKCPQGCTRCLKVCPGGEVDLNKLDDQLFGKRPDPRSVAGVAKKAMVTYSNDEAVRYGGTSGGLVTALLMHMLDSGAIDGALVLGTSTEGSNWHPVPFIARTAEDLKRAMKSKYTAVPFLKPLAEMENEIDANYAVVALPCYAHALHKYKKVSPKLRKRLKLIIGLYCNVVYEPYLFDDACEFNGIDKDEVADFLFRHGEWPGGVYARLKDGTDTKILRLMEMKDEVNVLKLFYTAPRCNLCVDFSAEYSDIAAGDPWLRGPDGAYLFEDHRTTLLVRTEAGEEALRKAVAAGYISTEDIPLELWMTNFEFSGGHKRKLVPKYIRLRSLFGMPVPRYGRKFPLGKASSWVPVLLRRAVLWASRHRWFRRLGLTLAQTRLALACFHWNRGRKERCYRDTYRRRQAYVRTLIGSNGRDPGQASKALHTGPTIQNQSST